MHTYPNATDSSAIATDGSVGGPVQGSAAAIRSKDELLKDFQILIGDGEALLRSTANLSGDALAQAREVFRGKLADAKIRAGELSGAALARGRHAAVAVDGYAHDNPWLVIGIAAGLGFVIGALATRR
jgi:ElaB/YqjD/DUF883 family membrane-anchored ribosome-binding protein